MAIFGATGGTGRLLTSKAVERDHEVTAAARNPSADLVEGQDAVITSIAVRGKDERKPTTRCSSCPLARAAVSDQRLVGRLHEDDADAEYRPSSGSSQDGED